MRSVTKYISKLSVMLSLAFLAGSCDDPEYPKPDTSTANTHARANILVVNASPGPNSINFLVDNQEQAKLPYNTKLSDQPNLNLINGYLPIFGGQRLLEINNFDPANAGKTTAHRQNFNTNSRSTVFVTDLPTRAASGSDPGGVRFLVLPDNVTPPAAGKAGLRFINVAPGSVSYGLYNTLTQQSLFPTSKTFTTKAGTSGTINNLQNRSFREISKSVTISDPAPSTVKETFTESLTGFTAVDPGTYNLDIRATATSIPAATKQNVVLEADKLYTIYIHGILNNATTPLGLSIIQHN